MKRVFARVTAFLGGGTRAGAGEIGQTIEIAFVQKQRVGFFIRQHILTEGGAETGEPFIDGGELVLRRLLQRAARAHEAGVIAVEHARLLQAKAEAVTPDIEIGDAGVERTVEIERVVVAGEQRRDLALDFLDGVAGVGAGQHVKDTGHAVEHAAAALQRLDGVGEGGRGRVGGDPLDLGAVLRQSSVESRAELLGLERAEGRQAERAGPVGE